LFFQIRLWDCDDVIGKVQEVYERLSPEVQAELPLRRVWTLVPEES
jgi:restriction system protein